MTQNPKQIVPHQKLTPLVQPCDYVLQSSEQLSCHKIVSSFYLTAQIVFSPQGIAIIASQVCFAVPGVKDVFLCQTETSKKTLNISEERQKQRDVKFV